MLYYKFLGKYVVLTAHNVNMLKRDGTDNWLNRLSLKIQYKLTDHIFVHTEQMKTELLLDFGVAADRISVIPFGINNSAPDTEMTSSIAKTRMGVGPGEKTILFFGQIAPYKGLEYLVPAFARVSAADTSHRLIIAGEAKSDPNYWKEIEGIIIKYGVRNRIITRIEHIPDDQIELFFKAADVLVLPYTSIFQSGVLFLAYAFGLPVIAANLASLKQEIVPGNTGFMFKRCDSVDLAEKIIDYFKSDLFSNLEAHRQAIKDYANERYSWDKVASITLGVYSSLHH
jgi:glycosyltransferase involved in cell wall biosynthesis